MKDFVVLPLFDLAPSDDLPNVNIMLPKGITKVTFDEALSALRSRDWAEKSFGFKAAAIQAISDKLAADAGHATGKFYIVHEDDYCTAFFKKDFSGANIGDISLIRANRLNDRGYISLCVPHECQHAAQVSQRRASRHYGALNSDYIREPLEAEARVAGYKFVLKKRLPFGSAARCALISGKHRFLYRLDRIKLGVQNSLKSFPAPVIAATVVPNESKRLEILENFCEKNNLSANTVFGKLTALETPKPSGSYRSLMTRKQYGDQWESLSFGEKLHMLKQTERDFSASYGKTARPVSTLVPTPAAIAFFGGKSAVCCEGTVYINMKDMASFEKMSSLDFRKIPERNAPVPLSSKLAQKSANISSINFFPQRKR